jgi:G6PDH family F420-dependent oxidoreductase
MSGLSCSGGSGCVLAIRNGGYVNFKGVHFRVDAARIWDLPDRSVPLGVAVSGQQSCELFAPLADVMIAVEPEGSLAGWWDAASGTGRPARKIGQMPVCWGPDRDECIRRAHEQFRWFGGAWKVNAELPRTAGFAGATSFVRPEDVAGSIPCGDSVDAVAQGPVHVEQRCCHLIVRHGRAPYPKGKTKRSPGRRNVACVRHPAGGVGRTAHSVEGALP